jgi:hypothetical protein
MNLFVCFRSIDDFEGIKVMDSLKTKSQNTVVILEEIDRNPKWKKNVSEKFSITDFVVFLLGNHTFESEHINWEFEKAVALNKHIIGIKLNGASEQSLLRFKNYKVFENAEESLEYIVSVSRSYIKIAV